MPADISVYTEPGSYTQESIQPNSLALSPVEQVLAIVGIAPRVRYVFNESVRRGNIKLEAVTFSGSAPYVHTLANTGNRRQEDTSLVRNGTDVIPDTGYEYLPATLTGVTAASFNIVAGTIITFNMDGLGWISILLTVGVARTPTQIATEINAALAADARYGVAYNAVATATAAPAVKLLSPLSSAPATSDLRFIDTPADTTGYVLDGANQIFGIAFSSTGGYIAPVQIEIDALYYDSTATYTLSYIALDTSTDALANTGVQSIQSVGYYTNVTSFAANVDYTLNSDEIDWTLNTQASITATSAGPYATVAGTSDKLRFSVNGGIVLTVTFAAATSAAAAASLINDALIAETTYGPLYGSVASVDGDGKLVLTAPEQFLDEPLAHGVNSSIDLYSTPANAVVLIFGIALASLPYQTQGVGDEPAPGAAYFSTYTYTRPTADYNNASSVDHLFTSADDALAYTGPLTNDNTSVNKLGITSQIAFENDCPKLILVQVNDTSSPGFPSINEVKLAIDAARDNDRITDICVLDTRVVVQTYLRDHVTAMSSLLEKSYRMGWFGMARNTPVGDKDTVDTFVFRAQKTLQVPPDSPGRGRFVLTAPPNVARTVTLNTGKSKTIEGDSTWLAVATAAKKTGFAAVATSLLRKTISAFDVDTFQVYSKAERSYLASNGVNVVTAKGGDLVLTDPVSTEQGAGNLREFTEINAMGQKDAVVRLVDSTLDSNEVGVTPSDLADFVADVKGYIALALRAAVEGGLCARYRDANGNVRDVNLATDIQVVQSPTDPTKFLFRYFFFLRYTAKRFFGDYSVDNPFLPQTL